MKLCLWLDFFLLNHFIVEQNHELPKCTSHFLSVPWTLKSVRIISWFIFFFFFNCFQDDVLCNIFIWADNTTLNSSCDKASDFSQQVEIDYEL